MPDLPPRVTMPLLTLITQQSLDEDYQIAAERRALDDEPARGGPGSRRVGRPSWSRCSGCWCPPRSSRTACSEDVENAGRSALIERIDAQRDRVDGLQSDIAGLRETNADSRGPARPRSTKRRRRRPPGSSGSQVRTGFLAVHGPGVRVTVDNAPNADANQRGARLRPGPARQRVVDRRCRGDLDQRPAADGPERDPQLGVPIEVNSVGIAPPYTVLAIGDTRLLQADVRRQLQRAGLRSDSRDEFGFTYNMDNDDDLSLPAAPQRFLRLRSATTAPTSRPKLEETGP